MAGGQRAGRAACRDGGLPEHPGPERLRQGGQPVRLPGAVVAPHLLGLDGGEVIKQFGVGAELAGAAGQGLGHPGTECGFQGGQRLVAYPGPGIGGIGVLRVVPGL